MLDWQKKNGSYRPDGYVFTHDAAVAKKMAVAVRLKTGSKHAASKLRFGGKPIAEHAMREYLALKREELTALGFPYFVVHGFRTTFASWADEQDAPDRDIEATLHHVDAQGKTKQARIYRRDSERLKPRRVLLQSWGDHCDRVEPLPGEVVPFRQVKGRA
jgi:integrase